MVDANVNRVGQIGSDGFAQELFFGFESAAAGL